MKSRIQLLLAMALAAGCASTPKISYFTLAMEPSGSSQPTQNVVVEQVRATDALNRREILIQASSTRIEYYATDHWVGGLADLVRQKLSAEFGPGVDGRPTLKLSATVLACQQVDVPGGAEAQMRLAVTVRTAAGKRYQAPLLEKTYEASRRAGRPSAGSVVEALSACAEEIASSIAVDVSTL